MQISINLRLNTSIFGEHIYLPVNIKHWVTNASKVSMKIKPNLFYQFPHTDNIKRGLRHQAGCTFYYLHIILVVNYVYKITSQPNYICFRDGSQTISYFILCLLNTNFVCAINLLFFTSLCYQHSCREKKFYLEEFRAPYL